MRHFKRLALAAWLPAALFLAAGGEAGAPRREPTPEPLVPPVVGGRWLRPARSPRAEPVWGVTGGIGVGLWPASGPRGLFRIYAPYLGQRHPRMVNYISVEPVVGRVRGQSELEVGLQGRRPGLAMHAADTAADALAMTEPSTPGRGRVVRVGQAEALTFYVATEPFRNGARPVIQVLLRADRPREVELRLHAAPGSARMDSCVLSATMGNYPRLRRLWLREEVVDARQLWPGFIPDPLGFAPWRQWRRDRLLLRDGDLLVAATPDEADPARAEYDPDVPPHWRYEGKPATHYWRTADHPGAVARVNGRTTYWGGRGRIPGGVSFENFEMEVPFSEGQAFRFGVMPRRPAKLGFDPESERNPTDGR